MVCSWSLSVKKEGEEWSREDASWITIVVWVAKAPCQRGGNFCRRQQALRRGLWRGDGGLLHKIPWKLQTKLPKTLANVGYFKTFFYIKVTWQCLLAIWSVSCCGLMYSCILGKKCKSEGVGGWKAQVLCLPPSFQFFLPMRWGLATEYLNSSSHSTFKWCRTLTTEAIFFFKNEDYPRPVYVFRFVAAVMLDDG